MERVEGVVERIRNQELCPLKPLVLKRLSSEKKVSHPIFFSPMGDGFPSCSRHGWELDVNSSCLNELFPYHSWSLRK